MTLKEEAEKGVRYLSTKWYVEAGRPDFPQFSEFVSWARREGYGYLLEFRSVMGPLEDAEQWFDEELKQTWCN